MSESITMKDEGRCVRTTRQMQLESLMAGREMMSTQRERMKWRRAAKDTHEDYITGG